MTTRTLTLLFAGLLLCQAGARAEDPKKLWDMGNTAFINGDFDKALAYYDSISAQELGSARLYYNIGNAHFKKGNIGPAILYYNKAQRLAPTDADVKHNLAVANTYVKDRIENVPVFFLKRWVVSWRRSLSSDAWTIIGLVGIATALASFLFLLLSRRQAGRKAGFYGFIFFTVISITATVFAVNEKKALTQLSEAIVMSGSAAVKSSPDGMSKDLFILHEGTKVRITGSLNQWNEIEIADGKKGWIMSGSIAQIN